MVWSSLSVSGVDLAAGLGGPAGPFLPEGMAVGTTYPSRTAGLGLFVILASALAEHTRGNQRGDPRGDRRIRGGDAAGLL